MFACQWRVGLGLATVAATDRCRVSAEHRRTVPDAVARLQRALFPGGQSAGTPIASVSNRVRPRRTRLPSRSVRSISAHRVRYDPTDRSNRKRSEIPITSKPALKSQKSLTISFGQRSCCPSYAPQPVMCPSIAKRKRSKGRVGSAGHITRPARCDDSLRSELPNGGRTRRADSAEPALKRLEPREQIAVLVPIAPGCLRLGTDWRQAGLDRSGFRS